MPEFSIYKQFQITNKTSYDETMLFNFKHD